MFNLKLEMLKLVEIRRTLQHLKNFKLGIFYAFLNYLLYSHSRNAVKSPKTFNHESDC